ncbi:MAG TPA: hypothetical protein VHC70_04115 [Phycisphaerales bacterium]|jgi:hypothetical protein|nr:hypothetical protein [Phycisphaerales bacterium]
MYRHLSQFVVKVANLAEAEGRELRRHAGKLSIGFALGLAAAGMLLVGSMLILAGIWLGLAHGAGAGPAWASVITGLLALALAGGGFAMVVKLVK